jgi:hypothetical protein
LNVTITTTRYSATAITDSGIAVLTVKNFTHLNSFGEPERHIESLVDWSRRERKKNGSEEGRAVKIVMEIAVDRGVLSTRSN